MAALVTHPVLGLAVLEVQVPHVVRVGGEGQRAEFALPPVTSLVLMSQQGHPGLEDLVTGPALRPQGRLEPPHLHGHADPVLKLLGLRLVITLLAAALPLLPLGVLTILGVVVVNLLLLLRDILLAVGAQADCQFQLFKLAQRA